MKNQKSIIVLLFVLSLTVLIAGCSNKQGDNYDIANCERFADDNETYLDCILCIKKQEVDLVEPCIAEVDKYVMEKQAYLDVIYSSPEKMRLTCSQIEDEEKKNLCYYYVAFNQTDTASCNFISNEELGINCVTATYSALYDQTSCKDLNARDTDFCYLYAAISKNESNICDNIVDGDYKNLCSETLI